MVIFQNILVNRDFYDVDIIAAPTENHTIRYDYRLGNARLFNCDEQASVSYQRIFAVLTHYFENRKISNMIDIDLDAFCRLVRMRKNDLLVKLDTFISDFKIALVHLNDKQRNVCTRRYFDNKRAFVKNVMYFSNMNVLRIVVDSTIRNMINSNNNNSRGFAKNYLWQQVSFKNIYSMQLRNFFSRMKDIKKRVKTDYNFKHLVHILPAVLPTSYFKFGNFVKMLKKVMFDFSRFSRDTIVSCGVFRRFDDEIKEDDNALSSDLRKMLLSGKRVDHLSFRVSEADDIAEKHESRRIADLLAFESAVEKSNGEYLARLKVHKNDSIELTDEYNFATRIHKTDDEILLKSCNLSIAKAYSLRKLSIKSGMFTSDDNFINALTHIAVEANVSASVKNKPAFIAQLIKTGYNINKKLFTSANDALSMSVTALSNLRLEELLKYQLINSVCMYTNDNKSLSPIFINTDNILSVLINQKKLIIEQENFMYFNS